MEKKIHMTGIITYTFFCFSGLQVLVFDLILLNHPLENSDAFVKRQNPISHI
jgi:hypothetical protein